MRGAASESGQELAVPSHHEPTVDVGIPTVGESPYLAEAVESMLAQTLTSWRLVIRENGPGLDSVRRTLEPYLGDPRVKHVVAGTKTGRGRALPASFASALLRTSVYFTTTTAGRRSFSNDERRSWMSIPAVDSSIQATS